MSIYVCVRERDRQKEKQKERQETDTKEYTERLDGAISAKKKKKQPA